MTTDEAFNALVQLAREFNPRLPEDLSGHSVTVWASKHGCGASAIADPGRPVPHHGSGPAQVHRPR
jgi:hypothetical protein